MPRLTFAIKPDGLLLPAFLGLDSTATHNLMAQGLPPPSPTQVRAQIDTGTSVTAVVPNILNALGAIPGRSAMTQTAGGLTRVRSYCISFTLFDPTGNHPASLTRISWLVTELPQDLPDVDVLFGMDLVRELVMNVDGPVGQFTLDF